MCTITNEPVEEIVYCEPDEDFYRSITAEEFLKRILEDIDEIWATASKLQSAMLSSNPKD